MKTQDLLLIGGLGLAAYLLLRKTEQPQQQQPQPPVYYTPPLYVQSTSNNGFGIDDVLASAPDIINSIKDLFGGGGKQNKGNVVNTQYSIEI